MIAYSITCHKDFSQVALFVAILYRPQDIFLVSVDDTHTPYKGELDNFVARGNVLLSFNRTITWGGISIVDRQLDGMLTLLEKGNWEYWFNLSGQDMPTMPLTQMYAELEQAAKSKTNFIIARKQPPIDFNTLTIENPTDEYRPFSRKKESVEIIVAPQMRAWYAKFYARILVDVCEVAQQKKLYINHQSPFQTLVRKAFEKKYTYYTGSNWSVLHRSAVEFICSGGEVPSEIYETLRHSYIPDESYLQTVIMASPYAENVVCDNRRLIYPPVKGGPFPRFLTLNDHHDIKKTKSFFTRKVSYSQDPALVEWIAGHVLSGNLNDDVHEQIAINRGLMPCV